MKIKIIKKATVFLLAAVMIIATAVGAVAAPYYEAGTPSNLTAGTAMILGTNGATRTISFYGNQITGPSGDALTGTNINQMISGTYNLSLVGGNIYNLVLVGGGQSIVRAFDNNTFTTYMQANALATQIDFNTHTISWGSVTNMNITNSIGSQSLTDMAGMTGGYAFTSFTFEQIGSEAAWLAGGAGGHARYYSKLEGFSAVPEPGEWMLMFIGLGMLGFYLQRRGYLNFDLSPQSVA